MIPVNTDESASNDGRPGLQHGENSRSFAPPCQATIMSASHPIASDLPGDATAAASTRQQKVRPYKSGQTL
jgi:hypothetical protein